MQDSGWVLSQVLQHIPSFGAGKPLRLQHICLGGQSHHQCHPGCPREVPLQEEIPTLP